MQLNTSMHNHGEARKRRCGSPMYFPRKVHISEEKVAAELENLRINVDLDTLTNASKPSFLLDRTQRVKHFMEIEDSIELEEDVDVKKGTFELAPVLIKELRKLNRKILIPGSYTSAIKIRKPLSICKELVLWRPPTGSAAKILELIKSLPDSKGNQNDTASTSTGSESSKETMQEMDVIQDLPTSNVLNAMQEQYRNSDDRIISKPHAPSDLNNSFATREDYALCRTPYNSTRVENRNPFEPAHQQNQIPTFFKPITNYEPLYNNFCDSFDNQDESVMEL